MKELYKGHKDNLDYARKLSKIAISNKVSLKEEDYLHNPVLCKECENIIPYKKRRTNKFCSKSCSASFNNRNKIKSIKTKNNISDGIKNFYKHSDKEVIEKVNNSKKLRNVKRKKDNIDSYSNNPSLCRVCGSKLSYDQRRRKTCSETCRVIKCNTSRRYKNGKQKLYKYKCVYDNSVVSLQSSWELEVATILDKSSIRWIRPEPIEWNDGYKNRLYFPDFYLVDYNVYLDPKNRYCQKLDGKKMEEVCKKHLVAYGHVEDIKNYITSL